MHAQTFPYGTEIYALEVPHFQNHVPGLVAKLTASRNVSRTRLFACVWTFYFVCEAVQTYKFIGAAQGVRMCVHSVISSRIFAGFLDIPYL